eukprot:9495142-Pyramimonas_sp.AAC.1
MRRDANGVGSNRGLGVFLRVAVREYFIKALRCVQQSINPPCDALVCAGDEDVAILVAVERADRRQEGALGANL